MRISAFLPISMTAIILAVPAIAQDNRSLVLENFQQTDANDDGKLSKSSFVCSSMRMRRMKSDAPRPSSGSEPITGHSPDSM